MTHDIDLDAPVLTRREALEAAYGRLTSVVLYCFNAGLEPDEMDKESIREAYKMVRLALKPDDAAPGLDGLRAAFSKAKGGGA